MLLIDLVIALVIVAGVFWWTAKASQPQEPFLLGMALVAATLAGITASVVLAVALAHSMSTPIQVQQLTNEHHVLSRALETPAEHLATATVLRLVNFNARVINWRRWERSLWIGAFYADLPKEVTVLELP